jgi:hypothetical protein
MPQEQTQHYCPNCGGLALSARSTPNHLVHALVTIFLFGLWLPIWVLACVCKKPFRCQRCGSVTSAGTMPPPAPGALVAMPQAARGGCSLTAILVALGMGLLLFIGLLVAT